MLSNRWLRDHRQTAENTQILYAKFYIQLTNIQRKIATTLSFHSCNFTCNEKSICAKPIRKYVYMLQSHIIGVFLANRDTKDPIVLQMRLIVRSVLINY